MSALANRACRAAAGSIILIALCASAVSAKERVRKHIFDDLITPSMMIQAAPARAASQSQPRFFTIAGVLAKAEGRPDPDVASRMTAAVSGEVASDTPSADMPVNGAQEPFGLMSFRAPEGVLWRKWRELGKDVEKDVATLADCRGQRTLCTAPASRFVTIIEAVRAADESRRIEVANRLINEAVAYTSDLAQHGVIDRWSSPLATLATGRGDCEDYAIAKYIALREAGVGEADLRILLGRDASARQDHAVLAVRRKGAWLILDNRWTAARTDAETTAFSPLYALDTNGVSLFALPYLSSLQSTGEMTPASAAQSGADGEWTGAELQDSAQSGATALPYLL